MGGWRPSAVWGSPGTSLDVGRCTLEARGVSSGPSGPSLVPVGPGRPWGVFIGWATFLSLLLSGIVTLVERGCTTDTPLLYRMSVEPYITLVLTLGRFTSNLFGCQDCPGPVSPSEVVGTTPVVISVVTVVCPMSSAGDVHVLSGTGFTI